MSYGNWEPVIGLEIHAQLLTESKMFSDDSTKFASPDNTCVGPVSLGLPGALPVVNHRAIEFSVRAGLALNCDIREKSFFARKNYFYPDLPKGYQISQSNEPICENGYVNFYLDGKVTRIGITRAHMEEDAGKSIHQGEHTLINLNRAGVPLLEIVSEPEITGPAQAAAYARAVRQILQYLGVCDGNLEEGSLRCDCNVSVRKKGETQLNTRTEIKNVNSFRFVEKAIEYEIQRQIDCYESNEEIIQETRLYDSTKNKTFSMRKKEEAHDYRYFPDPDLLPLKIEGDWIEGIKKGLPELPLEKANRYQSEYSLPEYDSFVLTQDMGVSQYFEAVASQSKNYKAVSNWVMGEVLRELKENKLDIEDSPIAAGQLAQLIGLIDNKVISGKIAKTVFAEMWSTPGADPEKIVKDKGLVQITDEAVIERMIDEIIANSPNQLEQYRAGKDKLFGFFVGQVMKVSKGQANPEVANKILKEKLSGH